MTILYIQNDPHGLILSAIAISTVFFCLLVLWGVYSLVGYLFTREKANSHAATAPASPQTQPDPSQESEIAAAIAIALELHTGKSLSGRCITFETPDPSEWSSPSHNFRKTPKRS